MLDATEMIDSAGFEISTFPHLTSLIFFISSTMDMN